MRLHSLEIEGFRRLQQVSIRFGNATFLIGANNSGKSSVLRAIECLLSGTKKLPDSEFYSEHDPDTDKTNPVAESVVLTAEFRNLPVEAAEWRGFRGRIHQYEPPEGEQESGLSFTYRKTFPRGKPVVIEVHSMKRSLKEEFAGCKSPQQLIDAGADEADVAEIFESLDKNLSTKANQELLQKLDDLWDISDEQEWFRNPGGIPGNVLKRLPRFLSVPAEASSHEIVEKGGALTKTLVELFKDVRNASDNYKQAQKHLDALAKELDPTDADSEFGNMMTELNGVLCSVFPDAKLHALANLSDPDSALSPNFDIEMESNVRTPVHLQGTGVVRSAVFGLLRFREEWLSKRGDADPRSLVIGFEEPEIYLHPSAANQMRDTIYDLASGSSQIIATTHSPYIIDLSRKPRQVLNRFRPTDQGVDVVPFSVTDEFRKLAEDDKSYVKMLLRIDDHIARVFFTKTAVIVEGDSEDLVLRQTISRLPNAVRQRLQRDFEVVRARGKASIIGLVKYLKALGIDVRVMHDRDGNTPGAVKFNAPIQDAVGVPDHVTVLEENLEDVLGYEPPAKDKPHRAFEHTEGWGEAWQDIPVAWRDCVLRVFGDIEV